MKKMLKHMFTVTLLLATLSVSAQQPSKLESWMNGEINVMTDHGIEVTKSLGQERDIQKEGRPLKWRCDIYSFTLPKQRRHDLQEMIDAFEDLSHEDPNCYAINSMSESSDGDRIGNTRNLMIGEDPNNYVIIGKDYTNFININVLDTADANKTHRYAYALEWREAHKGKVDVRYIITYAKIPSVTARIKEEQANSRMFTWENSIATWKDPLNHNNDPVTDVIVRMQQGKPITSDDLLCNENILLIFSLLKQQFILGHNMEFNAISIYTLCKRARECGFFTYPDSAVDVIQKAELDQLKRDIIQMKNKNNDETVCNYLQMALAELEKIVSN